MKQRFLLALAMTYVGVSLATTTAAQAQQVRPASEYKHPHTKITLPATLAGLSLTKAQSLYADSLDTATEYSNENNDTVISFYIFRKTNGDVPLWFDRANMVLQANGRWGKVTPVIDAQSFTPPKQTSASAMRVIYAAEGSPIGMKSTGLALLEVNDWYVKIRASSRTLDPNALNTALDQALAGVHWPSKITPVPAAVAIAPCTTKLTFAEKVAPAQQSQDDKMMSALLGGIMESAVEEKIKKEKKPADSPRWCRDASSSAMLGVYRSSDAVNHYMLGLADSGRAIAHGEDQLGALVRKDNKKEPRAEYSVTLYVPDQRLIYAPLNGLSPPDQLYNYIEKANAISSMGTWGKDAKTLNISQ